jgi:serine/threonine protein kinase/Tol biopolymer transport system component
MAVTIGSVLGTYEITALLGKGGFGEVYRAKDKKLKREVAIKLLPDEFSTDHDRLTRFQREAEVLASLNHPNIAAIYDLAAQDQSRFLVLELVDGETLADRITRGPIPVEEALNIAKQICEALEVAHEKGVIHRDLKPANIKVTPDGRVKVLDFGLAKIRESSSTSNLSNSPTLMTAATSGVILGTASYMSPEQAKGKEADRATDVWAFGCVLYEMLTGHQVFEGDTVGEVLGGIFKSNPDWNPLPTDTPANVRRLLRRCLQKDTNRRFGSAHDVRIEIEETLNEPATEALPVASSKRARFGWILVTAFMTVAFVGTAGLYLSQKPLEAPEMRLEITTPTPEPLSFAVSPDGKTLVFAASGDGPPRLWLRRLDKTDAQALAGTEGGNFPFWSPDNASIGFFANRKLKRIDLGGGAPHVLADAPFGVGGTWGPDKTILFSPAPVGPLLHVTESGTQLGSQTKLGSGQTSHQWPQFLPNGKSFLYFVVGNADTRGIYLGFTDGSEPKRLTAADSAGAFLPPDRLLFIRQTALLAQRFDVSHGTLAGDPVTITDPVDNVGSAGIFAVSASGLVAYRSGGASRQQLVWFDRTGKQIGVASEPDLDLLSMPEVSPDGKRIALDRTVQGNRDVWLWDLVRRGWTRFTVDPSLDGFPIWSPDGTQIAFESNPKGNFDIYLKALSQTTPEQPLLESAESKWPEDWSRDGRFLLYHVNDPKTGYDQMALPMTGDDRKPIVIANTPFAEDNGQFSPDGQWVAYQTDESGKNEIVVQSFPNPTTQLQVSTGGGVAPRWRFDAMELYFVAPDDKLMAATRRSSTASIDFERPIPLFQMGPYTYLRSTVRAKYAVSRDGHFLLSQTAVDAVPTPITLILNWHPKDSK